MPLNSDRAFWNWTLMASKDQKVMSTRSIRTSIEKNDSKFVSPITTNRFFSGTEWKRRHPRKSCGTRGLSGKNLKGSKQWTHINHEAIVICNLQEIPVFGRCWNRTFFPSSKSKIWKKSVVENSWTATKAENELTFCDRSVHSWAKNIHWPFRQRPHTLWNGL